MLVCIVCGKVLANVDPTTVRYGGCHKCSLLEIQKRFDKKDMEHTHIPDLKKNNSGGFDEF